MKKRLLSMLMAVLMIASLVPATALAADVCPKDHKTVTVSIKADAAAKQPGVEVVICNTENKVVKDVVTPFAEAKDVVKCAATGHSWKTVELQKATCEVMGVELTYCANCGTEKAVTIDKTTLGAHDWSFTAQVKPTCTKEGWGYAVCKNCNEIKFVKDSGAAKKLLEEAGVTSNTVVNAVVAMFAPTNSKHKLTDLTPVTEKTVVKDANGKEVTLVPETKATHTLTVSGQVSIDAKGAVTVVDIAGGNTNKAFNWVKKLDNNGNRTVDVYKDAYGYHGTGTKGDLICPDCGYYVQQGTVPGLNTTHKMTLESKGYYPYVAKDGTRVDGVTDVWYCDDCNAYIGGEKLPYADYVDYNAYAVKGDTKVVGAKAADCKTVGYTGDTYLFNGINWVLTSKGEDITVEHHWVKAADKAPTCTENGYSYDNLYVCDNVLLNGKTCGAEKGDKVQKTELAKGHTEAVMVLVAPTCTTKGMSVKYCSVCNEYITKNGEPVYYFVDALPCTAADELANVKAATCTEDGYTGDSVCKWCGKVLKAGEVVKAAGHTPEEVAAVAATCTETGLTAGSKCSVCGEVLTAQEVVPALGHKFENGVCTVCGEKDPNYVAPVVNPFKDVEKTSPYYDAIIWAAKEEITTGKTADTFGIDEGCTRAQIVTFLYRAAGSPEVKADTVNPFTDVSKDSVYYNAILWAVENGITKGTTDTTFDPNAVCTRGQIVTFLFRASGDEKVATGTNFADVASGSYCADAVAWAVANKVANGFADGTFRPEATCTRGQAVTFIYRALAE